VALQVLVAGVFDELVFGELDHTTRRLPLADDGLGRVLRWVLGGILRRVLLWRILWRILRHDRVALADEVLLELAAGDFVADPESHFRIQRQLVSVYLCSVTPLVRHFLAESLGNLLERLAFTRQELDLDHVAR